jgi:pilus assembly protein CpaB
MTRRLIGVLLAIVLAVVGTVAVLFYVRSARNQVAAGQQAVRVLVAAARIPAGTTGASIRGRKLVEEVVMPAASVPADTLSAVPGELDELVVMADVQPRQLLLKGMFGSASKISGGLQVPDKMLAVSVKLEVEEEVGGFIRPGVHIAVFGTFKLVDKKFKEEAGEDNKGTQLLLPRVEVLAVGKYGEDGVTSAQPADGKGGQATANVTLLVTVAVAQADAERLIHAVRIGELYAALLTDTSEVRPGGGVDNRSLLR